MTKTKGNPKNPKTTKIKSKKRQAASRMKDEKDYELMYACAVVTCYYLDLQDLSHDFLGLKKMLKSITHTDINNQKETGLENFLSIFDVDDPLYRAFKNPRATRLKLSNQEESPSMEKEMFEPEVEKHNEFLYGCTNVALFLLAFNSLPANISGLRKLLVPPICTEITGKEMLSIEDFEHYICTDDNQFLRKIFEFPPKSKKKCKQKISTGQDEMGGAELVSDDFVNILTVAGRFMVDSHGLQQSVSGLKQMLDSHSHTGIKKGNFTYLKSFMNYLNGEKEIYEDILKAFKFSEKYPQGVVDKHIEDECFSVAVYFLLQVNSYSRDYSGLKEMLASPIYTQEGIKEVLLDGFKEYLRDKTDEYQDKIDIYSFFIDYD